MLVFRSCLNRCVAFSLGLSLLLHIFGAPTLWGQEASQTIPEPSSGFRAEFLFDLADLEEKMLGLATTVPAEGYSWRPNKVVRSVSEVYMHMAESTYQILEALGQKSPVGTGEMEKVTDKAQVISALRESFQVLRRVAVATPDADLEKQVAILEGTRSVRAVFSLAIGHLHEHLGQSIAYARSIGVVPPWSEGP